MNICDLGDIRLHWRQDGDPAGPAVVFSNPLGTDLRVWDKVIPLLPQGYRYIRYDMRGHGLSDCPPGPYAMGALVRDAERLLGALGVADCIFVGLSIGGMIGQGLAVKRPDLLRGLVLSNTATKIGTPAMWQARIEAARAGGLEALADAVMERWFSRDFRQGPELAGWRNMLVRTPLEGYVGCCAAIAGTDFYTPTAGLRLPVLAIAGAADGSTPPDLVRETADLIPGAEFHLIRGAGHIPCVEAPGTFAARLMQFMDRVGSRCGCGHDHGPGHHHHHGHDH
ncbi:3-oxoadipate enol-lactonase [Gemmobacter sp.]|uniref:3-oxoadipate enol-lactonase n=1 Tax=Gemmobacter sp. TaxID=1898957 RepID=UPI002AFE01C8|nr:3-oxoadipate enol-lactonase [Gemmobacter sp.]